MLSFSHLNKLKKIFKKRVQNFIIAIKTNILNNRKAQNSNKKDLVKDRSKSRKRKKW